MIETILITVELVMSSEVWLVESCSLKFVQVVFGPMKKAGLLLKVIVALCRITALTNSRSCAHIFAKESVF